MKKYEEVIKSLATTKYHRYMGGSTDTRTEGIDLVAYIYGVPKIVVSNDVLTAFGKLFKKG